MDEARVARDLNRLGEDAFLFASDSDGLLDLVDEYFGDTAPTGNPTYYDYYTNDYYNYE